jgi:hypothetical protein
VGDVQGACVEGCSSSTAVKCEVGGNGVRRLASIDHGAQTHVGADLGRQAVEARAWHHEACSHLCALAVCCVHFVDNVCTYACMVYTCDKDDYV